MRLSLSVPDDFDFCNAVCSHGFFVLAPNRWDPAHRVLHTTIALDDNSAVTVAVSEGQGRRIAVRATVTLSHTERETVRRAVIRMLRIEEDLSGFHELCRSRETHRAVADTRFGRLLRGANLFEDMVKVICTCNVTWRQTVTMVDRLVEHWGMPAGDGRRAFPGASALAVASTDELREKARVGYRASSIRHLASLVASGDIDLAAIETFSGTTPELSKLLRQFPGIGGYAAANLCMLLGRYDGLAIDTEMMRFLRSRHPRRKWTPPAIHRYFHRWAPYQFLAYWFELWQDYAGTHGPAHEWERTNAGFQITTRPRPSGGET